MLVELNYYIDFVDCPKLIQSKPNLLAIVLGIIGGLLLAAIVALLAWKFLVSAYVSNFPVPRRANNATTV